jgi:DNA-binding NarL/FixJ family response regulator
MVAKGMGNKAIAREIGWAESTMKNQLSVLLKRLGVDGRVTLPVRAHQLGLIDINRLDLAS